MSPFEADLGYAPATPAMWKPVGLHGERSPRSAQTIGEEFLERQKDILAKTMRAIQGLQNRMSNIYDKNRPVQQFELGDRVLLSTANLATFHAGTTIKKLGPKWIGPYNVVEHIGHDYYRLELPTRVRFHPVFRTSMLKPYIHSERPDQPIFKVRLPDGTEGDLVEDIVDYRRRNGRAEYHVKWLGQPQLTWEPRENLEYVIDLINRYHQRHAASQASTRNEETNRQREAPLARGHVTGSH